jgi:chitodextrinase
MKSAKTQRWQRGPQRLPLVSHILELALGIIILASGQNIWAGLVAASPDITPPSVPANLLLSARTASTITISWDASTDDVPVSGYHVYRNGSLVGSPATTSFADSGLTPSTSYSYTVSAYDAIPNESAQSSSLPISTLADTTAPSTPANVHQTGATTSTISIAWNSSTDDVGVIGYDIFRNGVFIQSQTGTTFTDTGRAVFTSYIYTITANDAANNASGLSQPLSAATAPDVAAPSVPDNLHATGSTISSISLAWTAATDNVAVTGYKIYRDGSLVGSSASPSFTDVGLTVSTTYSYTVSAYDASNNQSAQSAPFSTASSDDTTAPSTPSGLHTTTILDNAVTLAWTASTDDVAVTGYKIYRDGSLVGTSTTTSYTDNGLSPATDYSYSIKAYDAATNTSPASSALATQTAYDTTDPSVPANLVATSKTDTSITLGWDAATDNIAVSGYDVYRDDTLIISTVGTNYTDSGLDVDTSYTYRVRARDGSGNTSAQSVQLITRTLTDQIPPNTISAAPTSGGQTTTSIDLSWQPATDDVAVVSYNVYRDGTFVTNVAVTDYTDTGLHYNRSYDYDVRALDAAGNESPASPVLTVATLPDSTAPTVNLTAPTDGQTTQLTFPISATASDDLELARVEFYADSALVATITAPPFSFNWNSYAVHNGARMITAKAIDASGNYSTHAIVITINNPPPPITGDINGDHKINIFDLSILLSHWHKAGAGDFNNNGQIDIFDLSVLLSHYGQDNSGYN